MAQNGETNSRALDKFYTRPEIADKCISYLHSLLESPQDLTRSTTWIEPSAGSGVFLERLPKPRIGLDLAPEASGIVQCDFLTWTPKERDGNLIVVGNPPFGKNANLAVAFFNHSASFADVIAFIVPRTFEKVSIQRRLSKKFHQIGQLALPLASFTFEGEDYPVPAVFQVWERRAADRILPIIQRTHLDFQFTSRDDAMLAFQRVGAKAGAIKTDFSKIADASHLFVKSEKLTPEQLIKRLSELDFSEVKLRTAGNPSISKSELITIYSESWGHGG